MSEPFPTRYERSPSFAAAGLALFAGMMLVLLGILQALEGLAAVLGGDVFVLRSGYAFKLDLTAWGWILLIVGVVAALVGAGIVAGQELAYVLGILIATLSLVATFLFLPYYPLASIVLIVFDIAVIWALAAMIPRRV
ncbi:hypothetical protein P5P86_10420 [Nocardioides sp. BP30]|uniref:DUF7144 family membrane protein n=1 Tax=Nocardioides sp. BP30 TaxID=3036374 RepID=UPI0024697EF0|nr:hypothetical protein [Nocardioides sp. BP30]WGL50382.1 hypothetical protein P5P86_10420 [Nocardioides sp. BP30]